LVAIFNVAAQKKVVIDNYFNNETNSKTKKPFHYLWDDREFSGFSDFGAIFTSQGAQLSTLKVKPTSENLKDVAVFIMVDPDHAKDSKKPNFMDEHAAKAIAKWVKDGGVLLMLTNDSSNCDLKNFNKLASRFGITYNIDFNHPELLGIDKSIRNFESCASRNLPNHPVFEGVSKIFIKEISSITCKVPAKPVLVENGKTFMAESEYGKGYVFAVGDPWLYNEYIDHAMLPTDFENYKAAQNLAKLLLSK